ncbi:EamA family transporter [Nitrospina gracilis]|uniref:EamA family transporter n=1 Tax=Nitrospina gracilis TaxID=35801 RepID=UPI001F02B742|nr:EamA family transporter [Nitrospina gracilis]MCF8720747.1 drug/metabolite transporter (DMT)-like permease [Nitrospina gracilis Nb-211]
MAATSIGLILLSCLFHALWNILTQTSRNSNYLSGLKGVVIIAGSLVFLASSGSATVPDDLWVWIVASGVLHGVYILSLSKAYQTQDISYVYPIARSAPVFVPVFAWFLLAERLSVSAMMSIVLILLAVYILHFDGHLIRGFRNLWDAILHKDMRWAFITLGLVVAYSLVDKRGMEIFITARPDHAMQNGFVFFFLEALIGFTLCNLYLFSVHPPREIVSVWKAEWRRGLVAAVATMGSYGLICVVLQFEEVSQVVAVRQTSVLMVVLWGVLKLKESFGPQRIFAGLLVVMGVSMMGWES